MIITLTLANWLFNTPKPFYWLLPQIDGKPSVNPVLWDSIRLSEKVGENLGDVGGISKILGKSLRFLEDFHSKSEDALLSEVMRNQFQQVSWIVLVIFVDVGEEVVQPFADIDLCQLAAPHKSIDDGSVLGSIVVSAEEIVLSSQSQRTYAVLDKVVVYLVPAVGGIAWQLASLAPETYSSTMFLNVFQISLDL